MSSISQLLAGIDDSTWEALGSKGLLRRATKELEKGASCEVLGESVFELRVKVSDATVVVPAEGPSKAKCSCGVSGCCHHLITAGLFLRGRSSMVVKTPEGDTGGTSSGNELESGPVLESLLALDIAVLRRWSGTPAWRAGLRLLASGAKVESEVRAGAVVVLLEPIKVECRFLPGTTLDGAIVSGGEPRNSKAMVVASVVGLKTKYGQAQPEEDSVETVLAEEKGSPRTRTEVLGTARSLLELTIADGLSHAGASSAERFSTLSVSAEGTNLPRLARTLKAVSDELGMIAGRHGRADVERTLDAMAQAYALAAALEGKGGQPASHLVGQHRTGYLDVESLDLQGVAGFPWQARSGFRGVTVVFWEPKESRWSTWTEARSISSDPTFDPLKAFDAECPWNSEVTVRSLASSVVRLSHAKRNAVGRLSSTKGCRLQSIGASHLGTLDFGRLAFDSWKTLARYISSTNASGLRLADPTADWIVISPARWGTRRFNRVEQRLLWSVFDSSGGELQLSLSYSDLTKHGVERLEQWEPPSKGGARVFGRFLRDTGEFAVEPLTIFPGPKLNFSPIHVLAPPEVSPAGGKPQNSIVLTRADEVDEESQDDAPDLPDVRSTDRWLHVVRDFLVGQAEAGIGGKRVREGPADAQLSQSLMDAGLPLLSAAVANAGQAGREPAEMLKAAYTLRLHEQCLLPAS